MIKYKSEEFLYKSGHRALVISGVLFGCAAIDIFRVIFNRIEEPSESIGFLIPAVIFVVLSLFFLLRGLLKASARKKQELESRQNFMDNGILSQGKVAAVGGGYYEKGHYRQNHVRRHKSRFVFTWEKRWWADIAYYNETEGTYATHRAMDLNKNGNFHGLIGREVDIYNLDQFLYVDFK